MSAELGTIGVVTALKYIGGIIAAWVGWVLKKNHDKLNNTYSKEETEDLIELKVEPIIVTYEARSSEIMKAIKVASDERRENLMLLRSINDNVNKMDTKVAVLGNEVSNIKDRLSHTEDKIKS